MRRFALLIAAVLLAGCSQNPVAPGDTIYNVTGGEALFKVSMKGQKLVYDSLFDRANPDYGSRLHYEIPFKIAHDSVLCVKCPSTNPHTIFTSYEGYDLNDILSFNDGVIFYKVIDSSLDVYDINDITFCNDTLRVPVRFCKKDTTSIISKVSTDLSASWFTFKVFKIGNN